VITVAVGSRNPNKVMAVEIAFRLMGFRANVIAVEPPKDLPPEPMGFDEILNGALTRANYALVSTPNAEFGVGIEAGIIKLGKINAYLDVTMAVIADRYGETTVGLSPAFMVPRKFAEEVLRGRELNDVAEQYYGVVNIGRRYGLIGAVTRHFIERLDLNTEAVYMALLPRAPWNKNLYST